MIRPFLLALSLVAALPLAAQELPADQAALKAHVQFLASDALRGREAGTPDFDVAAEYMAAQMLAAGLKPGANGSWFQPLKLVSYQPSEKARWSLTKGGSTIPLQFGIDFINTTGPALPSFAAQGQIVFAGYGVVYPQGKRDDYKGLDVRGKIVAIYPGVGPGLPSEVEAHFGDDDQKAVLAQARGAKAVIVLESPTRRAQYPFEAVVPYWEYERSSWVRPDGTPSTPAPNAPVIGYVSTLGAEKLFEGARIKWSEVAAADRRGAKLPTGPLVGTLAVSTTVKSRTLDTRNVIGLLEGTDAALKREYVVLSAHIDHVGVGAAVNGDRIYNGAMDNAVGAAMMIEVARSFAASDKKPRRSILFVALTGEEKGLIGSDYFTHYPVVPKDKIVADLNIDMPILAYPLQDMVALGGERSTLGPLIAQVAATEGLKVVPDPAPEEMFFVRSDHYSFVRAGIPAVSLDSGPGGAGAAAQKDYLARHYHKPSDQMDLPFDWNAAAKFTRVTAGIARAVADADERPRWNKGDFFGVQFKGYGAP